MAGAVTQAVIGPGSLLESDDRPTWWTLPGQPHRLEAAIGTPNGDGSLTIHHWFAGQARPDNPWLRGDVISARALGPAVLDQRGQPGSPAHELIAHVPEPDGVGVYSWAVNEATPRTWQRIAVVSDLPGFRRPTWDGPTGAAEWGEGTVVATATAATRLKHGWVQALVQVDGSLYHLHRQQRRGRTRWFRHACLRLADPSPGQVAPRSSRKVVQVSGETDTQPVTDAGVRRTLSQSESTSGVRGTDLGVRIDHGSRTFLLFGDTHWAGRRWLGTRDSIAEVLNASADRPQVRFHGAPLNVRGRGVTMREYDVPLDAFSLDGELYAFVTSNHFRDAQVMGRSVLTRVRQPLTVGPAQRWRGVRFRPLATLSDHRFINVSVQREDDYLYLWGTGAYRADDIRLARVDLTAPGLSEGLKRGCPTPFLDALQYWAGLTPPVEPSPVELVETPPVEPVETPPVEPVETRFRQAQSTPTETSPVEPVETRFRQAQSTTAETPPVEPVETRSRQAQSTTGETTRWSSDEADARPLVSPGAHGELSVRWVPELGQYVMLTMAGPDDPLGAAVVLRLSPRPWGPWSDRIKLFDWIQSGMSFGDPSARFIKSSSAGDDPVGDAMFRGQANATGAAYAPYLFDAHVADGQVRLRYTLSTWNPYQVVLMEHLLDL